MGCRAALHRLPNQHRACVVWSRFIVGACVVWLAAVHVLHRLREEMAEQIDLGGFSAGLSIRMWGIVYIRYLGISPAD